MVEQHDAITLIRHAIRETGGTWADLGAGSGTFTRALASLLGIDATVYAVDRDGSSLRSLARGASREHGAEVRTVTGDFTKQLDLPPLDGVLLANALHFVPYADQPRVIRQIVSSLDDSAPIVVVEYERRSANPYVPYPITFDAFASLCGECGLRTPEQLATRPSRYQGSIYSAVVRR